MKSIRKGPTGVHIGWRKNSSHWLSDSLNRPFRDLIPLHLFEAATTAAHFPRLCAGYLKSMKQWWLKGSPFAKDTDTVISRYECFLKWWYPTTMGFPTKNDHFGVFWGVSPFKETSIWIHAMFMNTIYEYVIACNRNTTWLSKISMEYMQRCERKQIRGYIHLSIV